MHREFTTGFRRTRPRRSKNFGLFCLAHGSDTGKPYPCLACQGQGFHVRCDLPGQYYPVKCEACQGTGKGTKEACRQAYQASLEAYRQEKDEYDRLARLRREALKRLTKNEIQALREIGV